LFQGEVRGRGGGNRFGEQYRLDCPFCGDRKRRLRVFHFYDPSTENRAFHCFNENCEKSRDRQMRLAQMIKGAWSSGFRFDVNAESLPNRDTPSSNIGPTSLSLPLGFVLLNNLPVDHVARQYITRRGFDADRLGREWGVGFVPANWSVQPHFGDPRIIIPVYSPSADLQLLGWQGRSISSATQFPRYLSSKGWQKSKTIFCHPWGVLASDHLIVVEGPMDVLKCGSNAVALFGKSASTHQLQLVVELARGRRQIVIALDRGESEDARRLARQLELRLSSGCQVLVADPPAGRKDLGDCSDQEISAWLQQCRSDLETRRLETPDRNSSRRMTAENLLAHAGLEVPSTSQAILPALASAGMEWLLREIEQPLEPLLDKIEFAGVPFSREILGEFVEGRLANKVGDLEAHLAADMRVRTQLKGIGGVTARIQSARPTLQNLDKPLRRAVVAPSGRCLVYGDFRQYELRVAAALSEDSQLRDIVASDDPYFHLAANHLSDQGNRQRHRQEAKQIVMASLYGSRNVESQRFRQWFPQFAEWERQVTAQAAQDRHVVTAFWRRVRIDLDDPSARKATNRIVSGTASDLFKMALLRVAAYLLPSASIILPMHDGILVECCSESVRLVEEQVRIGMQHSFMMVAMPANVRSGQSWLECS